MGLCSPFPRGVTNALDQSSRGSGTSLAFLARGELGSSVSVIATHCRAFGTGAANRSRTSCRSFRLAVGKGRLGHVGPEIRFGFGRSGFQPVDLGAQTPGQGVKFDPLPLQPFELPAHQFDGARADSLSWPVIL